MNELENAMRTVVVRVMADGGILQETAPLHSVELSQSAAQAKEAGQNWAVTVKCYADKASEAGAMAHAEMLEQTKAAKP